MLVCIECRHVIGICECVRLYDLAFVYMLIVLICYFYKRAVGKLIKKKVIEISPHSHFLEKEYDGLICGWVTRPDFGTVVPVYHWGVMNESLDDDEMDSVLAQCRNRPNNPAVYNIDTDEGSISSYKLFQDIDTEVLYIDPVEIMPCNELEYVRVENDY